MRLVIAEGRMYASAAAMGDDIIPFIGLSGLGYGGLYRANSSGVKSPSVYRVDQLLDWLI